MTVERPDPLTVLVIGAGGGMAVGINARIAAAGHTVLCADLSLEAAQRAADRVTAAGGTAHAFAVDATRDDSVQTLVEDVAATVGEVHALVNAAGVLDRKYLDTLEPAALLQVLDINLVGPYRAIRAFGPAMAERGWGRIVTISSIAGVTGYPYPSYAASKAGMSNLTRSLLVDFWGSGVTLNNICPGVVDTGMVIQEVRDQVASKVPTAQIVDPEEIGALVAHLLTDEARSINGADLMVDGGATALFRLIDDHG